MARYKLLAALLRSLEVVGRQHMWSTLYKTVRRYVSSRKKACTTPVLLSALLTILSLPAADFDVLLLHVQLLCALIKSLQS